MNLAILVLSLAVQAVNVLLAVRLMRRTGNYLAGAMIISTVVLMAFRRGIALFRYLSGESSLMDPVAESLALIISCLLLLGILYATRLIESQIRSRKEKEDLIEELRTAFAEIKTLKGIIPICSSCKKIRDDRGYWNMLEHYICEHSAAEFSHGICPECTTKLYPDIEQRMNKRTARNNEDPEQT